MDVITTHLENVNSAAEQASHEQGQDRILARTTAPGVYRVSDVSNAYTSAIGSRSRGGSKDSANRK